METPTRMPPTGLAGSAIRHGSITIDLERFTVTVEGRPVELTRSQFLLLAALMREPLRVFTRTQLAAALRTAEDGAHMSEPSTEAVDVHILRLRRKLGRVGGACIKTMRFVGYRFVPDRPPA
jgi:DNA-binding response OmpR family regulator